ncbi:hypothetical protein [Streptomyces sp. S.PB5]|uniref:hypothetical protein n=1 Tax=Streptomyces sp. S.PB5 TaxID=3020844 RepID=UPI0025B17C81|nr:hypothetical protein [Streptomyces sp. S.PB5]MDN3029238.1 hypothetical protein [Streptomyces sp. S.PB5]
MESEGDVCDGARVAGPAEDCLPGRMTGLRLIVPMEQPRPGARLRFTGADGIGLTSFATETAGEAIAAIELRPRR